MRPPSAKRVLYNASTEDDDKNSACLLGELYCQKEDDDYIFEDVFENVVDNELDNFIRGGKNNTTYTDGLGIASSDYDDLEEVCGVICSTSSSTGNRIIRNSVRPSTCKLVMQS